MALFYIYPIATTFFAFPGGWDTNGGVPYALVGAPTRHEAVDDLVGLADGNVSYVGSAPDDASGGAIDIRFSGSPFTPSAAAIQYVKVILSTQTNDSATPQQFRALIYIGATSYVSAQITKHAGADPPSAGAWGLDGLIWTTNPATGQAWTPGDLDPSRFQWGTRWLTSAGNSAHQFLSQCIVEVSYAGFESVVAREVGSKRLRRTRRNSLIIDMAVPLHQLNNPPLTPISVSHRLLPLAPSIKPFSFAKWQRHPFEIESLSIDLNELVAGLNAGRAKAPLTITARSRVEDLVTFWHTYLSRIACFAGPDGYAAIRGGHPEYFQRNSVVYVDDPSDGLFHSLAIGRQALARDGMLLEDPVANLVTRSSFKSGLTGWSGAAGAGVSYNLVPTTMFATDVTPNRLQLVSGGAAHADDTHTTAQAGTTAQQFRTSIWYMTDGTNRLRWRQQRSSDSKWWRDSDGTWQNTAQDNYMAATAILTQGIAAFGFTPAATNETYDIHVMSDVFNQTLYVEHVQIERNPFATSPIVTDGAIAVREIAGDLVNNDSSAPRVFTSSAGTVCVEFKSPWNAADMAGKKPTLICVLHDAAGSGGDDLNQWKVYYDGTAQCFKAFAIVGGVKYESVGQTVALVRGTVYRIGLRYTSTLGELRMPARTIEVCHWLPGDSALTKGTQVVRSGDPGENAKSWLLVGSSQQLPSSLTMKLWLRADSGVYKDAGVTLAVDNDTVQQWNDLSGNGFNFSQATAGNRPTFKTAIVNGLPVVRFDGINDYLAGPALSSLITASACHFFLAFRVNNFSVVHPLFADTSDKVSLSVETAGKVRFKNDDGAADNIDQTIATSTWYVVEGIHSGGNYIRARLLGTQAADVASGNTSSLAGTAELGRNSTGGTFHDGDIAEIIVLDSEMTNTYNLGLIQEYFQRKYNLTFSNNPLPVASAACNGYIRNLLLKQQVMTDEAMLRYV